MKKINDRDLAELSGYWAYQDLDKRYVIRVNNNKYRLIEDYSDNPNSKSFGGTDAKVFELVNSNNELTGQQAIIFQGTNNNKSIGSNNPFRGKVADDWIENIKLMNDKNKSTSLLEQNNAYIKSYEQKLKDADTLKSSDFIRKYKKNPSTYKNKTIKSDGGNSQGGASANHQGMINPNKNIVSTNPAMLPKSIWENFKSQNFENMINYHSKFDILSWLQDPFATPTLGKRVNLETGVPTMDGLVNSHLGYKRKLNPRYNTYKDLAVYKIKSVKDTMIKNGKKVKKTIEIDINMDDRIPINVWTGDSIARTGKGTPIKLNLENLSALSNLVTGETSNMLTDCVNYLNESYNISQVENANFGERKHKLKQDFKKIVEVDILEGMSRELTSLKKDAFSAIDNVKKNLVGIAFIFSSVAVLIFELNTIEEMLEDLDKKLQRGIESLHDSLDNVIKEMFKNLDHDFEDGVTEEMMKHLNVVNNNINFVKKQNDVYGEQITDIKNIMSHQDATVMDGNLSINYSGEHMISGQVQSSNYLTRKMTILKNHIDNAVNKISDYVQEAYNNYFEPVLNYILEVIHSVETAVRHIYEISSLIYKVTMKIKIKAMGINVDEIDKSLEVLKSKLKNLDEFLNNLKTASPILENHLDDIVRNMKPLIVNQIFEPSHNDDMFISRKALTPVFSSVL
ncbi:hypothetical protein [Staphylococcus aureus]|uniref:hypothetical protein n=1 Tax=Staphylococcus aureus TaxID=1280 RepID=UPI000914CE7B|nr:hypothetical protein [Staphylococcus aureus]MBV2985182.1 hypothetical protein [Staphylococcus aureus]MBV2993016.1 hypothetical protein [Staphylococcus aureus]MBV3001245.1 hypothetical protein [Staphylococcus aureus]SGU67095.1 lipoprotein [Staphylococcus aureus]